MFIEDFTEFVSTTLQVHQNNIYIGDFNLHVSEEETETDPAIFNNTIDAMGLYQHVAFPMHKSGNTLDVILTDIYQPTKIMTTAPGPYLTDHRAVITTLNIVMSWPIFNSQ